MGPRGPSRASTYRKPAFATLKNHKFFKVFESPRPPKTAYEEPRRLPRGYLGLLGAILSHLGTILETRASKIAPAGFACAWTSPFWAILGPILGPEISLFFIFWGVVFWTSFLQFWEHLLEPVWGPFLLKSRSTNGFLFLRGSWRLSGAILGRFFAVLGFSWEA